MIFGNKQGLAEKLIYQLIYNMDMLKSTMNPSVRLPTLDTVLMVERYIEQNSGEFSRTELWKTLPKQVMWQTYLVVIEYLQSINKIAVDKTGKIAYIWNPDLAKKLRDRKEIAI